MRKYGMFTDEGNRFVDEAINEWVDFTGLDGLDYEEAISAIRKRVIAKAMRREEVGEVYDTAVGDAIYVRLDYLAHPERAERAETAKLIREVLEASGHWDNVGVNEHDGVVYMQNLREGARTEWQAAYKTVASLRVQG